MFLRVPYGRLTLMALLFVLRVPVSQLFADEVSVGKKHGEERSFKVLEEELQMCWCPPGKFVMGDEHNEKEQVFVTLSHGFWMGRFEVTQAQWDVVMSQWVKNPSRFKGATLPVEDVSSGEAMRFCETLTKVARDLGQLPQNWEYRLPTEAQWEYACRAETSTAFSFGDNEQQLGDYAWYDRNSGKRTHPVAEKQPNGWACATCTEMFLSGVGTPGWTDCPTGRIRKSRSRPRPGCSGAAAGASGPCTAARRFVAGSSRYTATMPWASAWPQFRSASPARRSVYTRARFAASSPCRTRSYGPLTASDKTAVPVPVQSRWQTGKRRNPARNPSMARTGTSRRLPDGPESGSSANLSACPWMRGRAMD